MIKDMSELYYRLKLNSKSSSPTKNYFRVRAYRKTHGMSLVENGIAFYYNETRARVIETLDLRGVGSQKLELQVVFNERDGYETIKDLKFPLTIRDLSKAFNQEVNFDALRGV